MNHPLRATLGRTRRIPLAGLGRRTPGNYHPPYSTLPPKGPSKAAAVGAAGLLVAVPLTAYLVYRSQVRQVYPDPIQQLLRQALTAEHRVDHRNIELIRVKFEWSFSLGCGVG
ncbi:hypothetical protein PCANC_08165 [Puccinia coronata f. sp. avenae]|nr:hypothetical protein PCANC_08165 [Puccinia coronata f. sp. avenae]